MKKKKENRSVVSNSLHPHGLYSPGILQARKLEDLPGDLPNPWVKLRSPTFQADSLPAEPQGKPNTIVRKYQFFSAQPSLWSNSHICTVMYPATGKTMALTRWTFVSKLMSLLFNMLSRLVIAFLPRRKHLLFFF